MNYAQKNIILFKIYFNIYFQHKYIMAKRYLTKKIFVKSIVAGIVWAIAYLFIRRKFNPETSDNYMKYKLDSIYGGIAVFFAMLARSIAGKWIDNYYDE